LFATVVLAACEARFDSSVVVNDDESGLVSVELSLDDELRQLLEEQGGEQLLGFADQLQDVPDGWSAEEFTEGVFEGVRISAEFADFDDLQDKLAAFDDQLAESELALPASFRTLGLSRDGDRFRFEADLGQATAGLEDVAGDGLGGFDVAQIIDTIFTIRFIVTMPGEVIEHNADIVDEATNTLTWQITSQSSTSTLLAVSEAASGPAIGSLLAVGVIVLAVLGIIGLVVSRSRRRRAEELEATRRIDAGGV
jgi:hypothetical protein